MCTNQRAHLPLSPEGRSPSRSATTQRHPKHCTQMPPTVLPSDWLEMGFCRSLRRRNPASPRMPLKMLQRRPGRGRPTCTTPTKSGRALAQRPARRPPSPGSSPQWSACPRPCARKDLSLQRHLNPRHLHPLSRTRQRQLRWTSSSKRLELSWGPESFRISRKSA